MIPQQQERRFRHARWLADRAALPGAHPSFCPVRHVWYRGSRYEPPNLMTPLLSLSFTGLSLLLWVPATRRQLLAWGTPSVRRVPGTGPEVISLLA